MIPLPLHISTINRVLRMSSKGAEAVGLFLYRCPSVSRELNPSLSFGQLISITRASVPKFEDFPLRFLFSNQEINAVYHNIWWTLGKSETLLYSYMPQMAQNKFKKWSLHESLAFVRILRWGLWHKS